MAELPSTARYGDMTERGKSELRLSPQEDGDIVVSVLGRDFVSGKEVRASVEFCDVSFGGGA